MRNQVEMIEMQRVTEIQQMMDLRPENTPEDDNREIKIQNGMSITLDNDIFDVIDKPIGRGSELNIRSGSERK